MASNFRDALSRALPLLLFTTACIPFSVGSTARPVPEGETVESMSFFTVPNSFPGFDSTRAYPRIGADPEIRYGIDDRSDVGVRLPSYSGMVATYKRRLNGRTADPGVALAVLTGGGFVNMGDHLHIELSLLASGPENVLTPYGGVRAMQVFPINEGAVRDSPTIGGFFGLRIGGNDLSISPELGIFHDHSALGLRKNSTIIVPSITMSRSRPR
jgi:hypothetical protein